MESFQHLITEPHIADYARGKVLHYNIHLRNERLDEVATSALAQIYTDALLSAILLNEERAALVADVIEFARAITMRRHFNLDDLRAHPRHQARGRRTGDKMGKVENFVSVE